jgi:hypothetical protein
VTRAGTERDSRVEGPKRTPLSQRDGFTADATRQGRGHREDHGKSTIKVYENEKKNIALKAVYDGGLTSMVKAIVAPIQDVLKALPKRQIALEPSRPGIQPQLPYKAQVYDPNNVTKTTIRETMTNTETSGFVQKPMTFKMTVYDPKDVMKTTIRETTLEDAQPSNVRGPYKLTIYDPNDTARTTLKDMPRLVEPLSREVSSVPRHRRASCPNTLQNAPLCFPRNGFRCWNASTT